MSDIFKDNSKTAKIRYGLGKLKARGLVKKMQNTNYYVVTRQGWIWMWTCLFQKDYFVNPLLSISFKQEMQKITNQKKKKHYPNKASKQASKPDISRHSDSYVTKKNANFFHVFKL